MAVFEPRYHTRLLLKARAKVGVARKVLREHFDRDIAIHRRVVGFVDGRHTTGTELIEQPVWAEVVTNEIAHGRLLKSACKIETCDIIITCRAPDRVNMRMKWRDSASARRGGSHAEGDTACRPCAL